MKRVTVYREDSVSQVVYENVKHCFWTAGGTVLTIAVVRPTGDDEPRISLPGDHYYINWMREKIAWYKEEQA